MQESMGDNEWKQKYLDALHHSEEQDKVLNSSITQLRYGLSRISVAANGLDKTLDRQLVDLRRELRSGADDCSLKTHIKSISTTLQSLDESKEKQNGKALDSLKELISLMQNYDLPKNLQNRLKLLSSKLDIPGAENLTGVLLAKLLILVKEFLALIQLKPTKPIDKAAPDGVNNETVVKKSLFQRLIGKNSEKQTLDEDSAKSMISCLQAILEHIPVPNELEDIATNLRSRVLEDNSTIDACLPLLQDITDFVIQVYQTEQQKFGDFIKQVNKQLQTVKHHFANTYEDEQQFMNHLLELDETVRTEVTGLQQELIGATNIKDVASKMQQGLNSIVQHVDNYRAEEELRIKKNSEQNAKLEESLSTTENVADELRVSLSKQRLRANRDPVTGLYNRSAYNDRLEEEFARWQRDGAAFVLAVSDVDLFKNINDTYGHLAGDKVLKKMGQILIELTRATDFIARYGGEEFVFLIRNTPLETATVVLDKLRVAISECKFHFRGEPVQITMSFGLTQFKPYDTSETAFSRADKALYEAKQNGRNKVICKL